MATNPIGSSAGIDVTSLVSSLMTVEQQPLNALQKKQTSIQTSISSWGTIKSSFASLGDSLNAAATSARNFSATSSNSSVATATANTSSINGNYSLSVSSLAKSQVLASSGVADASTALTTSSSTLDISFGTISGGTLSGGTWSGASFSANGKSTSLSIPAGASLNDIASAINNSKSGVSASTIYDGKNWRLTVSSPEGADASMKFSVSGDSALSSLLSNDPSGTQNMKETVSSSDASFSINGLAMTRSSNVFSDAMAGVTISLSGTGTSQIGISRDSSGATTAANALASSWNSTNTMLNSNLAKGGSLQGDSTLNTAKYNLRNAVSLNYDTGTFTRLSQIGITMSKDGVMSVDSSKLSAAISKDGASVSSLLSAFGDKANQSVAVVSGTGGAIDSKVSSLKNQDADISKQEDAMQRRLDVIKAMYTQQFSSLNNLMNNMNSVSGALTNFTNSLSGK